MLTLHSRFILAEACMYNYYIDTTDWWGNFIRISLSAKLPIYTTHKLTTIAEAGKNGFRLITHVQCGNGGNGFWWAPAE